MGKPVMQEEAIQAPKGRVLIVDDDPHALEILSRLLGREGYECQTVDSGQGCLDALARQPADVIVLDVMMPNMDGLQVCEHLRASDATRAIPVILLTAKDDMETRQRGMALGVSEYLTKPLNKQELFTRIRAQVHSRELERRLTKTEESVAGKKKA
ncbi:MAG: response regulator [Deltaproteobacteria bacterium]|nr:response regulator [Deltaproteobacteria bacterium]MBI3389484.1 response regulator [Deltaproteobacteria bacterium]